MDKVNNEGREGKIQETVPHSFSYDGYEVLHDEEMDKISVSILYSDCDEMSMRNSQNNLATRSDNNEKKMKISLSQEQLKLNLNNKNFLSVPTSGTRKIRSPSFSSVIETEVDRNISIPLKIATNSGIDDEIIYAIPRRLVSTEENEIKTSSASLSPWKSVSTVQTSSEVKHDYKYPLSYYCNICNNTLSDPRTLDCLHSFCMQCLARLDATNDLQNNQFWRKISERSDNSCKL